MTPGECTQVLRSIAASVGCPLRIGGERPGAVVGSPPACAELYEGQGGEVGVWILKVSSWAHVEQVLHELGHHRHGVRETYAEERAAFEWAAAQAKALLPAEVSAEVARMAGEALM